MSVTSDKFDAADIMDEVSCICGVAVIGGFFSGDGECDTTDLAIEELIHYREVLRWIHSRGLVTASDTKDPYVLGLRQVIRKETNTYLLDRLLTASVIEARGAERFALIADAIERPPLKNFYKSLAKSEARHYRLFLELAAEYFDSSVIELRWKEILNIEAEVVSELPIRAALH